MVNKRLVLWVLLGIPVYLINFALFSFFLWIGISMTLAFWSWIIAAPLTLKMWDFLDTRVKEMRV